jgi:hypothetical protein
MTRRLPLAPPRRLPLAHAGTPVALLLMTMVLLAAAACSAVRRGPPRFDEDDYPGTIRPAASLPVDVLWQQRVTASWGERGRRAFDAALQKRGDELVLVGLSPMGSPGFVVRLDGLEISVHNPAGEELPFPPRFLLLDVQRTFYPWLAQGATEREDGTYEGVVGGERVVEVVRDGRLVERRFTREDGRPEGVLAVRYEWAHDDWRGPSRAVLDNGWFGYRLDIVTVDETALPPPDAADLPDDPDGPDGSDGSDGPDDPEGSDAAGLRDAADGATR